MKMERFNLLNRSMWTYSIYAFDLDLAALVDFELPAFAPVFSAAFLFWYACS